jgi:hypothetical protein
VVQDVERILARAVEAEVLQLQIEVVQTEDLGFTMDPRIGVDGLLVDGVRIDLPVDDGGIPTGGRE